MNKVNEDINDNEEQKIDIEIESNDLVTEVQNDSESSSKPDQRNNVDLQKVKVENNINPLFNEIGPFPIKPPTVWIQYNGQNVPMQYQGPVQNVPMQYQGPVQNVPMQYQGAAPAYYYEPSRNDFVRLVFILVLIMLICTAIMCSFCMYTEKLRNLFANASFSTMVMLCGTIITVSLSYAFACSNCTRDAPCSYVCLGLATLGYSMICSVLCIRYEEKVILAVAATTVVVAICLALSFTSFDFTRFILIVIVAIAAVCVMLLLLTIYTLVTGQPLNPVRAIILIAATLLNCIMLIIELQMILGGKSVELSEDDYAFAAYSVYASIIVIFLNILKLLDIDWNQFF